MEAYVYRGPMCTRTVQNNIRFFVNIILYILVSNTTVNKHPRRRRLGKRESKELWWKHTQE